MNKNTNTLNSNISDSTNSSENSSNASVKLLDPKLDAIFQILFSKSNPRVIKGLLSSILDMPITNLEDKTVNLDLNKILDRTYPDDKIGVLDVRAQINNELEIDLEMQMPNRDALLERILWCWSKLYSSQLKNNDDYSELKKTLEILIINDTIPSLQNIFKPCTRWHIREDEIFSEILTDKLEIVIIELPKVEKALRDDNALFDTGKRIGKEEAQKEMEKQISELREKACRIAKKLLALNIPIEQISEATELSLEEIKNISNNQL